MELNSISNNSFYQNYNSNLQNVKAEESAIANKSDIVSTPQNVDNVPHISAISPTIKQNIENISTIQQVQKQVISQVNLIDKLDYTVNNSSNINAQSSNVNQIFEQYNNNAKMIYSNLNELVEDQHNGDSHMFFDGVLGSVPMSIDEINKASAKQKAVLNDVNKQLEETMQKEVQFSKKLIETQTVEAKEASPFKQIDFGKESANFTSNNLHNVASSMVSVQSSTAQAQSIRILA